MTDLQNLLKVLGEWRGVQDRLLAAERELADAWVQCAQFGAPEPKELLARISELRHESDRLLRNVIVAHRLTNPQGVAPNGTVSAQPAPTGGPANSDQTRLPHRRGS